MGHLILKLTSLLAFVGGPLYVADMLKPAMGPGKAVALVFGPQALMLFAALTMSEEEPTPFARAVVQGGLLGTFGLLGLDVYAAWQMTHGHPHKDGSLIWVGLVMGVVACSWYLARARAYLSG